MTPTKQPDTGQAAILDHDLNQFFPELLKFESTPELEASDIYPNIKPQIDRILNAVVKENLSVPPASAGGFLQKPAREQGRNAQRDDHDHTNVRASANETERTQIKALAWNIERGTQFCGILNALKNHQD